MEGAKCSGMSSSVYDFVVSVSVLFFGCGLTLEVLIVGRTWDKLLMYTCTCMLLIHETVGRLDVGLP